MNTKIKKKLCWNCEGRVSLVEEHCSFCGVYLSPSQTVDNEEEEERLFSPPYSVTPHEEQQEAPPAPYAQRKPEVRAKTLDVGSNGEEVTSDGMREVLIPLGTLLSGSIFFLFGIVLLLFSKNGTFTLQWSGVYWYLYALGGAILLFFGWRTLQDVSDD